MTSQHFLHIYSPDGIYLDELNDYLSIECVLAEMAIGTLTVTLPPTHDASIYRRDGRLAYYRAPSEELGIGSVARLVGNTTWLIARRQFALDKDLNEWVRLVCVHPNALLGRRVVAYDEGTSQADKTDQADDMIKAYVRENVVSATDTTRNWSSSFFSVEADVGAAPSVSKAASYRNVLTTLREVAAAGATAGTYTGFEVYSPSETGAFTLRTYTGQRGTDRSTTSSQPLVLSVLRGALEGVELDEDWTDIASFAYAGGSGKGDERVTGSAQNSALINESPYGRIEWFQNAASTDDTAVLADEAGRALRERRPRQLFTGAVVETEYATFMEEYDWGDRVVGEYARLNPYTHFADVQQFDCRVDPVRIRVDRTEDPATGLQTLTETLDIRLRSEA